MTAYAALDEIPVGVLGDITRSEQTIIVPAFFAKDEPVKVGKAACFDSSGKLDYLTDPDSQKFAGIIVRTYPAGSDYPESTNIPKGRLVGLMKRGRCLVHCPNGTPVMGGEVHFYKTDNGAKKIGDFSAEDDSGYTSKLENLTWASSGVSTDKLAELEVL